VFPITLKETSHSVLERGRGREKIRQREKREPAVDYMLDL
jgi:hypothetical protein